MLKPGERAALQFSGGKDSRVLLELARPYLDRVTVYFADTGAVFPHIREYVFRTCRDLGARLEVVLPSRPVQDHIDAEGLPSDVVPVEATLEMQRFLRRRPEQLVQSYMTCCAASIFTPLEAALRRDGHVLVLRGSRRADRRVGLGPEAWSGGIEYRSPLWDWSDARVLAFVAERAIALPGHYAAVPDSLDCWLCTAHTHSHGAAKLRWMREHTPDLWRETAERFRRLEAALDGAMQPLLDALDETGEP